MNHVHNAFFTSDKHIAFMYLPVQVLPQGLVVQMALVVLSRRVHRYHRRVLVDPVGLAGQQVQQHQVLQCHHWVQVDPEKS